MTANLSRQFKSDPGKAFLEIIKGMGGPATLGSIRDALVDVGIAKAEVNTKWKAAQPFLAEHPNIRRPTSTGYVWSAEPVSADVALASLAKKRKIPDWLRTALVDTVAAALGTGSVEDAVAGQRRQVDNAKVLADIAGHVEELAYGGEGIDTVLDWLRLRAAETSLEFIGRVGQTLSYDPREHVAVSGSPQAQSKVTVVRPGFIWRGGEVPVLVSRALVRPTS